METKFRIAIRIGEPQSAARRSSGSNNCNRSDVHCALLARIVLFGDETIRQSKRPTQQSLPMHGACLALRNFLSHIIVPEFCTADLTAWHF